MIRLRLIIISRFLQRIQIEYTYFIFSVTQPTVPRFEIGSALDVEETIEEEEGLITMGCIRFFPFFAIVTFCSTIAEGETLEEDVKSVSGLSIEFASFIVESITGRGDASIVVFPAISWVIRFDAVAFATAAFSSSSCSWVGVSGNCECFRP